MGQNRAWGSQMDRAPPELREKEEVDNFFKNPGRSVVPLPGQLEEYRISSVDAGRAWRIAKKVGQAVAKWQTIAAEARRKAASIFLYCTYSCKFVILHENMQSRPKVW